MYLCRRSWTTESLDDGREDSAQQDEQDGISDSGEECFDTVQGGELFHRSAHEFQAHEQKAEAGQDAAQGLGTALFGKDAQEGAQAGEGREDDARGQGIAPNIPRATICAVTVVPMLAP